MVGGLIMAHGDDQGLVVPPALAAVQAVVVLVKDDAGAGDAARRLGEELAAAGVRNEVDDRVATSFGRRTTDWELKGVPVRIEVGPRDLANGEVTSCAATPARRRRSPSPRRPSGSPSPHRHDPGRAPGQGHAAARRAHRRGRRRSTTPSRRRRRAGPDLPWDLVRGEGEERLAQEAVTVRCLQRADGTVPDADDEPDLVAFVGRSY